MCRPYAAAAAVVHGDGHLQERGFRPTSLVWCRRPRASGDPHSQAGGMHRPREQINRMTPVNLSWLPPLLAQASDRLTGNLGELAGGATVWLAVTGLSRSGKTVFITSLIH